MGEPPGAPSRQVLAKRHGLDQAQMAGAVLESQGFPRGDIARAVGVSAPTVARWRNLPEYAQAVDTLRELRLNHVSDTVDKIMRELMEGVLESIKTLRGQLEAEDRDGNPMHGARHKAAVELLNSGVQLLIRQAGPRGGEKEAVAGGTAIVQVVLPPGESDPRKFDVVEGAVSTDEE